MDYTKLIVDLPDYPEPGVVFKDITPLLGDPDGFASIIDDIADAFKDAGVTKVMGSEARGFMIGAPVAYALHAGFVPARKPGKLPRETIAQHYALEYGHNTLEIHKDALTPDDVVLIVDDLCATGGTLVAQVNLVKELGATLAGIAYLMELTYLDPRSKLEAVTDAPIVSLVNVESEQG